MFGDTFTFTKCADEFKCDREGVQDVPREGRPKVQPHLKSSKKLYYMILEELRTNVRIIYTLGNYKNTPVIFCVTNFI